ncbi:hypothetical protein M0R45_001929 [Rubus argutus]|uniref:Uncharacterized protein n=1 Tax=Rubus argutus TaxID=59490 RepID=A0AAW1VGC6_RUBAR
MVDLYVFVILLVLFNGVSGLAFLLENDPTVNTAALSRGDRVAISAIALVPLHHQMLCRIESALLWHHSSGPSNFGFTDHCVFGFTDGMVAGTIIYTILSTFADHYAT